MVKIHVIIPVYNALKYLSAAVDSVLSQPCRDIDIVLVNDGSTDGSDSLCDTLAAENSRISVIHQKNAGVSSARNAGIDYVLRITPPDCYANHYITFLDADDLWFPSVIDTETVRNFQSDVIGYSCYCANCSATRLRTLHIHLPSQLERPLGTVSWFGYGLMGSYFYRLPLFTRYGLRFPVGVKGNEDIIFLQKVGFCCQSVVYTKDFLYIYRMNPASYTHTAKYLPENADHVPFAWLHEADWAYSLSSFSSEQCAAWKSFCIKMAGARILEASRGLAESCIPYRTYKAFLRDASHCQLFGFLCESFLSDWQKADYQLFRSSPLLFYCKCRFRGTLSRILKQLLRIKKIRHLREQKSYPITFDL